MDIKFVAPRYKTARPRRHKGIIVMSYGLGNLIRKSYNKPCKNPLTKVAERGIFALTVS